MTAAPFGTGVSQSSSPFQASLQRFVAGSNLESFLEGCHGLVVLLQGQKCFRFPPVRFVVRGFDRERFVGIVEGFGRLPRFEVCRRTFAVHDVILGLEEERFRIRLNGFFPLVQLVRHVAFVVPLRCSIED